MDNNKIRLKVQWPSAKREKYITELSNMKERQNTRCKRQRSATEHTNQLTTPPRRHATLARYGTTPQHSGKPQPPLQTWGRQQVSKRQQELTALC